ncbi:MAG: hypothetical protein IPM54_30625 [Polyangiaceae bacterium]|nr:hypothetical protein [Polyangiaceae bacterium]
MRIDHARAVELLELLELPELLELEPARRRLAASAPMPPEPPSPPAPPLAVGCVLAKSDSASKAQPAASAESPTAETTIPKDEDKRMNKPPGSTHPRATSGLLTGQNLGVWGAARGERADLGLVSNRSLL